MTKSDSYHLITDKWEEVAARDKYLRQATWIDDLNIKDNLERIAKDEQIHIEILTELHQKYHG